LKRKPEKQQSSNEFAVLAALCARASADEAFRRLAAAPGSKPAAVAVDDAGALLRFSPSGAATARAIPAGGAPKDAVRLDSATLHKLLSGAINLMLALNKADMPDHTLPGGVRLLLNTQPRLAHIYRVMQAERSAGS